MHVQVHARGRGCVRVRPFVVCENIANNVPLVREAVIAQHRVSDRVDGPKLRRVAASHYHLRETKEEN